MKLIYVCSQDSQGKFFLFRDLNLMTTSTILKKASIAAGATISFGLFLLTPTQKASAAILFDTSVNPIINGTPSQQFTDLGNGRLLSFDDFTVTGNGWEIDKFTAFGIERSSAPAGDPSYNVSVNLDIYTTPDATTSPLYSFVGTYDSGNLIFDLDGLVLDAGDYWANAYVTRSFNPGGQWYWYQVEHTSGSEGFFQSPDGLTGPNTAPISESSLFGTFTDHSLRIEGKSVPEPASVLGLLAAGALGAVSLKRKDKEDN